MMKPALGEISSFFGYFEERNTSLRLKWPKFGPHTVYNLQLKILRSTEQF